MHECSGNNGHENPITFLKYFEDVGNIVVVEKLGGFFNRRQNSETLNKQSECFGDLIFPRVKTA